MHKEDGPVIVTMGNGLTVSVIVETDVVGVQVPFVAVKVSVMLPVSEADGVKVGLSAVLLEKFPVPVFVQR